MIIEINNQVCLDKIKAEDKPDLISYINHPEIYRNTLTIPEPYTQKDADWWVIYVDLTEREEGRLTNWAIRFNGQLIGGIGLMRKYSWEEQKDEFGYWLGAPFWNKGIMTQVVKKFCLFCSVELKFTRLEAPVFYFNKPSAKVLEKSGFVVEREIKNYYKKNDCFIDAVLYSKQLKAVEEEGDQGP